MRLILLAVLALGVYGQSSEFPPEIVPPEVLARRDPLKIDTKQKLPVGQTLPAALVCSAAAGNIGIPRWRIRIEGHTSRGGPR
ncbi:MAG: hypothetical protein ACLP59_33575 [Bryobacteraceae bacterium]